MGGDLEGADVGLASVGLVAGHDGEALVVDLEIFGGGQVEFLPRRVVGYVLLKLIGDQGQPAGDGAGGVDYADPVGVGLSVEGPHVVVDAVHDELERGTLGGGVAVVHRGEIAAGGELRRMAGDAELGFRMLHGGAEGDGSSTRGVGKPGVAHVDEEVHAGAHGQVRIGVGRDREVRGVELVGGMVSGYADVVLLAGLKDAGAEFVEAGIILGGFYLVDEFSGVEGDYVGFVLG